MIAISFLTYPLDKTNCLVYNYYSIFYFRIHILRTDIKMHTENLSEFIKKQDIPSKDVIIYHNHKEVYRYMCGHKDSEKNTPLKGDELYYLYSTTKPITCTAGMRLIERGIIGIDDPVSKYIPEYATLFYKNDEGEVLPCKKVMTVRHLFSMRGGFSYNIGAPAIKEVREKTNNKGSTLDFVRAFVRDPLLFEPGTRYNYSLCHDVLAAVIEIASGKSFGQFLKEEIFTPLGMENTGFFPTEEQKKRFVAQYSWQKDHYTEVPVGCAYRLSENYESGGAGLFSCVNDYIKFADALANHGTAANGYQLLRPETVELMRSNQAPDMLTGYNAGYGYGFGVRTMLDKEKAKSDAPTLLSFGWDGAAGSYVSIDPENRIAIFYAQQVLAQMWVYNDVHPVIRDTAYYIADICK